MKKIIAFSFLLITVVAFAQNDILKDTILKPVITGIGKPDGEKVNLKIGEEGGRLKSSDGKVELVFPAGALSANTNIIIQPVTNLAPNGSGMAYWFEPSGIQFKKPVQIIINYTDEEAEICPPDLMGLAIQNKQGQWSFINYDSWDSTAKSLKGSITHFSGATNVNKIRLSPNYALIKVGIKLPIELVDISRFFEDMEEGYEAEPRMISLAKNKTTMWYVNDVQGGDGFDGIIVPYLEKYSDYTAPPTLPTGKNPVAIKVELYVVKKSRGGKTLNLLKTFKSKIHIYDEYGLKMIHHSEGDAGSGFGKLTYKDTGFLVIRFNGKQTEIIEKINKNTVSEMGYKGGKCRIIPLGPGSGSLHISGIMGTIVTPATRQKPATVEISFDHTQLVLPLLQVDCPGKKSRDIGNTAMGNAFAAQNIPAMPIQLKFDAKVYDGKVVIETFGKQGAEIFYQVEIWQIKDD
jgi:hypothetical protein